MAALVVSMDPTVRIHEERFVPLDRYDREVLDTSARLLRLLALLQTRPWWSGPELADRLEVTTRTIRNDIDRLRSLGYPVDAARGSAGGYRLGIGAVTPPLLLDDDEAVAVAVALSTAAGSITGMEEAAVRALVKLEQLLPSRLRRRVGALQRYTVDAPRTGPTVDPALLTTIATACRDHEGLRVDYRRHDGESTRRALEPHRLVHVDRRWYLLAWDLGRDDWRTFRVDRISLPRNHAGDRFVPRSLPSDDVAEHVTTGIESATWAYRAEVVVHAPADHIRPRLPSAVEVEVIDDATCLAHVGADDAHVLALHIGMIDADITVDRDAHPELAEQLALLAERFRRAATGERAPSRGRPARRNR
jgi:predicted DNA-binding transcriptional regulator YafY